MTTKNKRLNYLLYILGMLCVALVIVLIVQNKNANRQKNSEQENTTIPDVKVIIETTVSIEKDSVEDETDRSEDETMDLSGDFTGDESVSDYVRTAVASVITDGMTLEERIKAVYDYVGEQAYPLYLPRSESTYPEQGEEDYSLEHAKFFVENGGGNCFSFAAIFKLLADAVGCETKICSGMVHMKPYSDNEPARHGWVEIKRDGEWYVYDPELAYSYNINLYKAQEDNDNIKYYIE